MRNRESYWLVLLEVDDDKNTAVETVAVVAVVGQLREGKNATGDEAMRDRKMNAVPNKAHCYFRCLLVESYWE